MAKFKRQKWCRDSKSKKQFGKGGCSGRYEATAVFERAVGKPKLKCPRFSRKPFFSFRRATERDRGDYGRCESVGWESFTVDIFSGRCISDSFIAATIHYVGDEPLKNAFLGLRKLEENRHSDL
ncbi:hypothetical protein Tcan_08637 [Toxocara canis]|uniref:Uncharacterized protein n=1 Tax=Toxocara canis TaxID=6265 RepID=A0A0B2VX35_TOXCA|nr:hypothetical protein Tcan_08637 [Toxocara canis]